MSYVVFLPNLQLGCTLVCLVPISPNPPIVKL